MDEPRPGPPFEEAILLAIPRGWASGLLAVLNIAERVAAIRGAGAAAEVRTLREHIERQVKIQSKPLRP